MTTLRPDCSSSEIHSVTEDMMDTEDATEHDSLLDHQEDEEPLLDHQLANLDVDKLLVEKLGEFGLYQKLIYLLVCLPAALTAGLTLGSVFTEYVPDHRCYIPGCDDRQAPRYDDADYLGFINFTIPVNSSSCESFVRLNNKSSCTKRDFSMETSKCDSFLFDDSVLKSSLVSEFGLVCRED